MQIDQLLQQAEEYTFKILRTSVQLRESELMHQKRSKKNKDSKRKNQGQDEEDMMMQHQSIGSSNSAVLNFAG